MSFHILHLFEHGSYLRKERGRLIWNNSGHKRSLPIENIRAVVIAAKGITLSSALIGDLLSHDAIIVHCDDRYRLAGLSVPAMRTIDYRIIEGQIRSKSKFIDLVWGRILKQKVENQADVLDFIGVMNNPLKNLSRTREIVEGNAARVYFRSYFQMLQALDQNRSQRHTGWLNGMLNYGFTVLGALVHRSIIVHGLLSNIGIHHRPRYRAEPLVYDLMEPLRAVVEGLTARFVLAYGKISEELTMRDYARFIGINLREFRIEFGAHSLKLVDALDRYARSFANACIVSDHSEIWLPRVKADSYTTAAFYRE